ncbi:glycosyltransferase family 4 protein [Flavivirga algicola]|uniref:Glycosyltransferase family 4 protein n=1 Tax=Flavivirga algicola TaxID=2729136 RepID=A0ABX1RT49_9FLAO|nr:glycosyltransferase family 4 protein [Flavivirga algicola]NMH86346.1 glycosyltransferase family 4 protein [Flavivirga algicola]
MQNDLNILVSNIALPSKKIGSWTTRLSLLNNTHNVFNYILSPSNFNKTYLYCRKRKFITWRKEVRKFNLKHWVAKDYLKAISKLSKKASRLTIVIMDDTHLLEAIAISKSKFNCPIKIIFSFHGFKLQLENKILKQIDKVLFLSNVGYEVSKTDNFPKVEIVGNGVNSNVFYPLNDKEYIESRLKKGYIEEDEILIWVANDRPKKGFHIFSEVVQSLLETIPSLKVIIIGTTKKLDHKNVSNIGRISNNEVSKYLQISNYYMFTTFYEEGFGLSMAEALKCGNAIIASNRGAIPEVLNNIDYTYQINDIENIDNWVKAFNLARKETNHGKKRRFKSETDLIWDYKDWEQKFINAILES